MRAVNSFLNAERRCFDYLNYHMGSIEGVTGYIGKWDRKTQNENELVPMREWYFAITGDGGGNIAAMISPSERPKKAWAASAIFKARFTDRKTALLVVGMLIDILPAGFGGDTDQDAELMLAHIQHFGPQDNEIPAITEDVFTIGDTGYEQDGWLVEMPLQVVFGLTDEPELD